VRRHAVQQQALTAAGWPQSSQSGATILTGFKTWRPWSPLLFEIMLLKQVVYLDILAARSDRSTDVDKWKITSFESCADLYCLFMRQEG